MWLSIYRFFYRCKICPLTFFSKSDMQIHSKTHTEAKAHRCPHCTKTFANASYLAQHLRIHLGTKPYRCSYCEKCFRQLSHLQQHTRFVVSFPSFTGPTSIRIELPALKLNSYWSCFQPPSRFFLSLFQNPHGWPALQVCPSRMWKSFHPTV